MSQSGIVNEKKYCKDVSVYIRLEMKECVKKLQKQYRQMQTDNAFLLELTIDKVLNKLYLVNVTSKTIIIESLVEDDVVGVYYFATKELKLYLTAYDLYIPATRDVIEDHKELMIIAMEDYLLDGGK